MSTSEGEEGGLFRAAPTDNSQDLLDKSTKSVATGSTPEDQVRVHA